VVPDLRNRVVLRLQKEMSNRLNSSRSRLHQHFDLLFPEKTMNHWTDIAAELQIEPVNDPLLLQAELVLHQTTWKGTSPPFAAPYRDIRYAPS
jgi:hypothetical protein